MGYSVPRGVVYHLMMLLVYLWLPNSKNRVLFQNLVIFWGRKIGNFGHFGQFFAVFSSKMPKSHWEAGVKFVPYIITILKNTKSKKSGACNFFMRISNFRDFGNSIFEPFSLWKIAYFSTSENNQILKKNGIFLSLATINILKASLNGKLHP